MTDAELAELIATLRAHKTDLRQVEAKRAQQDLPKSVRETLSSFSNSPDGGTLVLGLDEQAGFAAVGVGDPKKVLQDLGSLCNEMEPPVRAVINPHRIGDATLVVAEVPEIPREQKPCYYKGAGLTNGAYVRTADGDYQLSPYEVQVMLASRGQPTDDVEPVEAASAADLDAGQLEAFVARVRARGGARFVGKSDAEVLRQERVLVPSRAGEPDYWVPSLAGLLVFGTHPQAFFPRLLLLFTAFPGRRPGELGSNGERTDDDARCEGSIAHMLLDALPALHRNLRRSRTIVGALGRVGSEYPDEAVREAVVNALGHRDLSPLARGTPVQLNLFTDRLEVTNPGGLFGPVTVERLGVDWVTSARNPVLMRLLEDAVVPGTRETVAESRGTGIGATIEALRRAGMSPPRFDDKIGTFRVTFPRHSLLDVDTLAGLGALEGAGTAELAESQRMALALMRAGEVMTNARYRQVSGKDSRVVTAELRDLVDRGLAEMRNAGRWTQYGLGSVALATSGAPARSAAPSASPGRTPADATTATARPRGDRRPEIRRLLADAGPLSRAEVEERLNSRGGAVAKWLRRMLQDGEVTTTRASTRDPYTKYQLTEAGRAALPR